MDRLLRLPVMAAAAVGAAGALLIPATAWAVVVTTTLTVDPAHGGAGQAFTATYTLSPCQTTVGTTVDFWWNGHPPTGGTRLGSAPTDATCTAKLVTAVPAGVKAGGYIVYGFIALPDGSPTNGTTAAAAFTVDATSSQPSASASAASGTGSSSSAKTGSGTAATGVGSSAARTGSSGGNSTTSLLGPLGLAALVIAGLLAALLALFVVLWLRATRRDHDQAGQRAA